MSSESKDYPDWLFTSPGTSIEFTAIKPRRTRPCWRCRWHLRWPPRHYGVWRMHWQCRPVPSMKYLLEDLTGPRDWLEGPPPR